MEECRFIVAEGLFDLKSCKLYTSKLSDLVNMDSLLMGELLGYYVNTKTSHNPIFCWIWWLVKSCAFVGIIINRSLEVKIVKCFSHDPVNMFLVLLVRVRVMLKRYDQTIYPKKRYDQTEVTLSSSFPSPKFSLEKKSR